MANVLIDENILIGWADQIREKTGSSEKMRPSVLLEKTESLGSGGGSSDLVKYVTFMSEDVTQELYKMPVLSGDDCKDPVTHGDIDAPTKESTESIVFTHIGWSLEIGGEMDNSALSDVTANRVVYAVFDEGVRYYTVNLWLAEGELFESVQVPYGGTAIPSEEPEKADHVFIGWEPALNNVTSNRDCYAQFTETTDFKNASWTTVSKVSKAGKAKELYSLGDTKTLDLGELGSVTVEIAGFDHDVANSITLICKTIPADYKKTWVSPGTSVSTSKTYRYTDYIASQIEAIKNYMPEELQSAIRSVAKKYDASKLNSDQSTYSSGFKVWIPSLDELGFSVATTNPYVHSPLGEKYELYSSKGKTTTTTAYSELIAKDNNGNATDYFVRNLKKSTSSTVSVSTITSDGKSSGLSGSYLSNIALGIRFAFCV